jgi:drug/metabolite transporter (DMT)-like permease
MIAATLLWGGTFVVLKGSLEGLDPVPLVFSRFAAATLILTPPVLLRASPISGTAALGGMLSGMLGAAGYLLQAIGLTTTTAGTSAFLTSTGSLLAGIFAWPLLGQRPGAVLLGGIALAAAGSALLPARSDLRLGTGELTTLLGAIAFALQIVVLARVAPRADPIAIAAIQAAALALTLAPFAAAGLEPLTRMRAADGWRMAYLIVAGSVIAPLLQIFAQRSLSPGRVGLLFGLEPIFALSFALVFGGERFAPRWWWGAALILLAVWSVEWISMRREGRSPSASR